MAEQRSGFGWLNLAERMGEKPLGRMELELWKFAALAGESASHPRDMQRFYQFIVRAHTFRSRLSHGDIKARLLKYGFRDEIAARLAEAYWHGRCSLSVSRRFAGDYARWVGKNAIYLY